MTPIELWQLPAEEFNKWRRENDLRELFSRFQQALPLFNEWLNENHLTIDFILDTNQPGEFFFWENDVFVVKSKDENYEGYFFVPVVDDAHDKQIREIGEQDHSEQIKFKPYLRWAKNKLKKENIINGGHSGDQETFRYNVYSAAYAAEISSATLNIGKTVLKLGGTTIDGWGHFVSKNLDFTNLDL